MYDNATSCFLHRSEYGVFVIGLKRSKVDHLGADAIAGELIGGCQSLLHHRAPADQRHILPLSKDKGDVKWQSLAIVINLAFRSPVDARRLEERDWIGITDRGE